MIIVLLGRQAVYMCGSYQRSPCGRCLRELLNDDSARTAQPVTKRIAEIEGTPDANGRIPSPVMTDLPAFSMQEPLPANRVIIVANNDQASESFVVSLSSEELTHPF